MILNMQKDEQTSENVKLTPLRSRFKPFMSIHSQDVPTIVIEDMGSPLREDHGKKPGSNNKRFLM